MVKHDILTNCQFQILDYLIYLRRRIKLKSECGDFERVEILNEI